MSLAALGLTGCEERTTPSIEKEPKPADARVVLKTQAYTDMGEGVFLIHDANWGQSSEPRAHEIASNLATWKREHPGHSINVMLPMSRSVLDGYGVIIETTEKASSPAK